MLGNEREDRVVGEVLIGKRLQVGMVGEHKGVVLEHDGHAIRRAHALDHDELAAGLHAKERRILARRRDHRTRHQTRSGHHVVGGTTLSKALDVTFLDNLALELGSAHKGAPPLLSVEISRARQLLDGATHGDASHAVRLRELHLGRNARAGRIHAARDLALQVVHDLLVQRYGGYASAVGFIVGCHRYAPSRACSDSNSSIAAINCSPKASAFFSPMPLT